MQIKNRKKNRLQNYDYSQNGLYFVTICTKNRIDYFGKIENGKMISNKSGKIIERCWLDLPNHYSNCVLNEIIIMPNHLHCIIEIRNVGTGLKPVPTNSLSEIIRGFKTFSSRRIHLNGNNNFKWQRSFYDHVIRNEISLNKIIEYIKSNPIIWQRDRNNPDNIWI